MNKIDPSPRPSELRRPVDDAEASASQHVSDKPGMMHGRGRSIGFLVGTLIAVAAIVTAGLSFGWKGWLTAGLGGISILFLLPCAVMCIGVVWMMVRGGRGGPS